MMPEPVTARAVDVRSGAPLLEPSVTVMVTTCQGDTRIRTCLDSLAAQSLDPDTFEILVVQNGPPCATPQVVADFKAEHPRLRVRLVELSQAGLGHARNVGLQAARGTYVTYVDDDDWVTPSYLSGLLAHADVGVVPSALVSTVLDGAPDQDVTEPSLDNYATRSLMPFAGRTVTCDQLPAALSYNAGKLLHTSVARLVRYDESLGSGEDFIYWLTLLTLHPFRLRIAEVEDDAVYCRSIRETSLGRQGVSYDFMVSQRLDCLEALERIDQSEPVPARVARRMRRGQVRRINAYLAARPDEHARVVDDVRRRGLRQMPWHVLNRGLGRDLAIAYCFPPYLDTSGLVAARRLRERGVVTDVISNDISKFRALDRESLRVAAEVVDRTEVLDATPSFGHWDSVTEFAQRALETVDRWESEKGHYRSVYSRSMAVASHFAAALVKIRRPDIEWVAEFSDPLKFHPDGRERTSPMPPNWLSAVLEDELASRGHVLPPSGVFAFSELMTYALADRLVFTNQRQLDLMMEYCPDPGLRARALDIAEVRHHPTLPRDFYSLKKATYELDRSVVNIAYFGVFYITRGLEEVMEAIRGLRFEDRERVRLHVFTSRSEQLRLDVARAAMSDVVVVRPLVPFLDFLALTTRFDVLLVKDAEAVPYFGMNPYLPSKVSDYRGSGTPVWGISEEGSVLDGMDSTHRSRLGDAAAAQSIIEGLVRALPAPVAGGGTGSSASRRRARAARR